MSNLRQWDGGPGSMLNLMSGPAFPIFDGQTLHQIELVVNKHPSNNMDTLLSQRTMK